MGGKGHFTAATAATAAAPGPASTHAAIPPLPSLLQRGQTTQENELVEQLTIELLSSSGSSFPCCDDACVGTAAAAVAALICHEGSAEAAAAAISQLFPTAQAVAVHCPSASCPGQLTLGLQQAQRGTCRLTACTCSAADVLLRSAAAACTLDGSHEGEAEQATLAALGEILGQQLRQHVKQQVEVRHQCTAGARKRVGSGGEFGLARTQYVWCMPRSTAVSFPTCAPVPRPGLQVLHAEVASRHIQHPAASHQQTMMGH